MKDGADRNEKPLARTDVLQQTVGEEVVVVDTRSMRAHCLNDVAAFVWSQCNGESTVEEIGRRVGQRWGHKRGRDVAYLALKQLAGARLITDAPVHPRGVSRRTFLSRAAIAVAAIPVVASVVVPTPAYAQTCGQKNDPCGPGLPPCCPGLSCNLAAGKCK